MFETQDKKGGMGEDRKGREGEVVRRCLPHDTISHQFPANCLTPLLNPYFPSEKNMLNSLDWHTVVLKMWTNLKINK